jgi:hypothetical protein
LEDLPPDALGDEYAAIAGCGTRSGHQHEGRKQRGQHATQQQGATDTRALMAGEAHEPIIPRGCHNAVLRR